MCGEAAREVPSPLVLGLRCPELGLGFRQNCCASRANVCSYLFRLSGS